VLRLERSKSKLIRECGKIVAAGAILFALVQVLAAILYWPQLVEQMRGTYTYDSPPVTLRGLVIGLAYTTLITIFGLVAAYGPEPRANSQSRGADASDAAGQAD